MQHSTNNHLSVSKTGRKSTSAVYNSCTGILDNIGYKEVQQNVHRTSFKMPLTDGSMYTTMAGSSRRPEY